ncbi:MAG: 2-phosphoglycolate phosphatase [Gammaproteobacteria bacterium]|nr:MAG: 2-phosphoglycolate phosphatase [Gammaproteobacteria bacterium]TND07059.1 MAG: 2-phosphoglycolate phosphatase [Gammaproteobacteria bacterium]
MRSPDGPTCIRTVLFDLDGTLADTAPDLAHALNQTLAGQGRAPLPFEQIRPVVSHGGTALLRLGFQIPADTPEFEGLREQFLQTYRRHIGDRTRLFPGIDEVLAALQVQGLNWGVVTNKPRWLTEPLMAALGLTARAASIVSGDSTTNRKPHPEPMLRACREAGSDARHCLYVGDAERDIEAGRRAGMKTLVALFGYLGDDDHPETWQADGMVKQPLEILDWIKAHGNE